MTTAPKKRAPKASPQPAIPAGDVLDEDDEIRPVRIGKRTGPVEMTTVFELDGREYQVPTRIPAALYIKFMKEARDRRIGQQVASENLVLSMLGTEAFDALAESPDVTDEHVGEVFGIVARIAAEAITKVTDAAGN